MITDAHTHHPTAGAIVNFDPVTDSLPLRPDLIYSVGIHPWNATLATPQLIEEIDRLAADRQIVAIGETGLDTLHGDIARQLPLFTAHIDIARRHGLPLIIHCVKAWQQLIAIRKDYPDDIPWIIHGFRGKPELARQLIGLGFYLSFGARYNPASLAATPPDRRLIESDETTLPADITVPATNFTRLFTRH